MHLICRTCLLEVTDNNILTLTEDTESLRVKTELSICVPEVVVDIVINPIICFKCIRALHAAYEFKTQCLQTELRINNYIKDKNLNSDSAAQNLQISSLQSCIGTTCLQSTARDIIDDLNSLLDEALQNVPNNEQVKSEDIFDQYKIQPHEIPKSDEDQKLKLKECFVKCVKLPDSVAPSNLVTQNTPRVKVKLNEVHKCNLCAYKNRSQYRVELHAMIHSKEKLYQCSQCSYGCAYKNNLKRHMTLHSDEKPFTCDKCPYKAGYVELLKKHIKRFHGKDYKFPCNKCWYKGTSKDNLEKHVKRQHGDGPNRIISLSYSCTMCSSYTATSMENLRRHIIKWHKDEASSQIWHKPHACKKCSFKSTYEYNLTRHLRRNHGEENP